MFTGIIEKTSKIEDFSISKSGAKIVFSADFDDVKLGCSIAVNGVCLTIVEINSTKLSADIMNETLNSSNLKNLKRGDIVNLERAMSANSRYDGSIVTGHIDETIKVAAITSDGFSKRVKFNSNSDFIVKKGTVVLNGVSLTVSDTYKDGFEVSLIPATIENTNLKNIKIGDIINVEYDILAKYVKKFTSSKKEIDESFLKENGFM